MRVLSLVLNNIPRESSRHHLNGLFSALCEINFNQENTRLLLYGALCILEANSRTFIMKSLIVDFVSKIFDININDYQVK